MWPLGVLSDSNDSVIEVFKWKLVRGTGENMFAVMQKKALKTINPSPPKNHPNLKTHFQEILVEIFW